MHETSVKRSLIWQREQVLRFSLLAYWPRAVLIASAMPGTGLSRAAAAAEEEKTAPTQQPSSAARCSAAISPSGSGAAKNGSARRSAAESSACSDTAANHAARGNTTPQRPECTTGCLGARCPAPESRAASGHPGCYPRQRGVACRRPCRYASRQQSRYRVKPARCTGTRRRPNRHSRAELFGVAQRIPRPPWQQLGDVCRAQHFGGYRRWFRRILPLRLHLGTTRLLPRPDRRWL